LAIFITSTLTAFISLFDTRRNMVKLASTAKYSCQVNRFNFSRSIVDSENVNSIELVPGDLIEVSDQLTMPCDCVMIQVRSLLFKY
jgi:cation-transporting ATPase 13A2